jgi:translation initiation factor 1 (eIF-1/SUI1)
MNPFENISTNDDDNTTNTTNTTLIEIWVEAYGRKKNTYVSGWNITEDQLKEHLKCIKKNNGCNGTIKEMTNESGVILQQVLQLQGNHSKYIKEYIISNDVDSNNIRIKG